MIHFIHILELRRNQIYFILSIMIFSIFISYVISFGEPKKLWSIRDLLKETRHFYKKNIYMHDFSKFFPLSHRNSDQCDLAWPNRTKTYSTMLY